MPIAAAIPAIIGAAGSIGGSLLGKKGSSGSTAADTKQLNDLLGDVRGMAGKQSQHANKDWRQFHKSLDPVRDWFTQLLTGDRTKLMEVLGPEVEAKNKQFDAVSKAIAEFSPRGGGRSAAMGQMQFEKAKEVGDLFATARPMAAQGLESVAGMLGTQSSAESGTAMSGLSTALSGLLGMRGQDISQMMANRESAQQLGGSLGMLLSQILGGFGGGHAPPPFQIPIGAGTGGTGSTPFGGVTGIPVGPGGSGWAGPSDDWGGGFGGVG